MIRPMHRLFWLGLPMVFTMAGCAGMKLTDFGHRNPTPIGDRPLSVINGRTAEESATRSNSITSTIDAKDARRISGRVMDHRGQPVSGATVRLADGALAGGSVSDVITDEAGGFTVRGLRASTPYTLIATLDLGGESRISRARFLSGETQARVLLEPDSSDQSARDQVEYKPANRPKLTTAKIESRQDQPSPPKGKWVFVEDGQNAEETTKVALKLKDKSLQKVSDEREANEPKATDPSDADPAPPKLRKNEAWRATGRPEPSEKRDYKIRTVQYSADDGQNPLPPAIERKPYVYEEFQDSEGPEAADRRVAARPNGRRTNAGSVDGIRRLPDDLAPVTEILSAEEIAEQSTAGLENRSPRRAVAASKPRQPALYTDAPSAGNIRVEQIDEINRLRRAERNAQLGGRGEPGTQESPVRASTRWDQAQRPADELARTDRTISRTNRSTDSLKPPADFPDQDLARSPESDASSLSGRGLERSPAKRERIQRSLEPAHESTMVSQIEPDVARTDQERIDRLKSTDKSRETAFGNELSAKSPNEWVNRMTGGLAWWKKPVALANDEKVAGVFCDFDVANQRIMDFELPDVKGRPTRLSQMPSDLTLLFFWGTWCKPCHEALPHLVELQRRLASDNVQVIGISYEEGTTAERQKKVALAADRYNINFPLLMGSKGGADSCPVRKSLAVQVYPTMVLLDRDGRVLWRDQGTTPATMGRLDRVLASHLRELDSLRLARSTRESR